MAKICVNLHPKYTYSTMIISDGYINQMKEYIKFVDWLDWDWLSLKKKPIIRISGESASDENAIENHLERTTVVLQRLINSGNHDIFVRNERTDEWQKYKQEKNYSDKQMYDIEIQKNHRNEKIEWVKRDIKKYSDMLLQCEEKKVVEQMLFESEEKLKALIEEEFKKEQIRFKKIKEIWT